MIGCSGGDGGCCGGRGSRHWFRQRGGLSRLGDRLGRNRGLPLGGGNKEGFYL